MSTSIHLTINADSPTEFLDAMVKILGALDGAGKPVDASAANNSEARAAAAGALDAALERTGTKTRKAKPVPVEVNPSEVDPPVTDEEIAASGLLDPATDVSGDEVEDPDAGEEDKPEPKDEPEVAAKDQAKKDLEVAIKLLTEHYGNKTLRPIFKNLLSVYKVTKFGEIEAKHGTELLDAVRGILLAAGVK